MYSILTNPIPNLVTINNENFRINADFSNIIKIITLIEDEEKLKYNSLDIFNLFYIDIPNYSKECFEKIFEFINYKITNKNNENNNKIVCFNKDSDYIFATFFEVYKIDLTENKLHWFKFITMLRNLPSKCAYSKIMGYRSMTNSDINKLPKEQRNFYVEMKNKYSLKNNCEDKKNKEFNKGIDKLINRNATQAEIIKFINSE